MNNQLKIPKIIERLISINLWPDNSYISNDNLQPFIDMDRIKLLIPDEENIYLYSPPFPTVNYCIKLNDPDYSTKEVKDSLTSIDINKTVLIGDFGYGSEADLALDYSKNKLSPSVIRLKWDYDDDNLTKKATWVHVSDSFEDLINVSILELENLIDVKKITESNEVKISKKYIKSKENSNYIKE